MTTRRDCLALAATAGVLSALPPRLFAAEDHGPLLTRPIPSTGEQLPIIGLGSSATFSEAAGQNDTDAVRSVLAKMLELGGRVFDTAPGYGASEQVAGKIVKEIRSTKSSGRRSSTSRAGAAARPIRRPRARRSLRHSTGSAATRST